jgi:hypothetical protein
MREGAGAFTVWAYAAWSAPRGWLESAWSLEEADSEARRAPVCSARAQAPSNRGRNISSSKGIFLRKQLPRFGKCRAQQDPIDEQAIVLLKSASASTPCVSAMRGGELRWSHDQGNDGSSRHDGGKLRDAWPHDQGNDGSPRLDGSSVAFAPSAHAAASLCHAPPARRLLVFELSRP